MKRCSTSTSERSPLCLDRDENVLWWYRNLVGKVNFAIQGSRRNRIYPDFVAQQGIERPLHTVLVLEGRQQLGQGFKVHVFRFQVLHQSSDFGRDRQDELHTLLANAQT